MLPLWKTCIKYISVFSITCLLVNFLVFMRSLVAYRYLNEKDVFKYHCDGPQNKPVDQRFFWVGWCVNEPDNTNTSQNSHSEANGSKTNAEELWKVVFHQRVEEVCVVLVLNHFLNAVNKIKANFKFRMTSHLLLDLSYTNVWKTSFPSWNIINKLSKLPMNLSTICKLKL